jgi:RNA polymerase sigma factor CnrH
VTVGEMPPDELLAARAAAGDEHAFADLVRRHKEPLYRLLRRYTGDADEAYEAAHEAFIAAWSALRRYDPQRPFIFWLRAIAINKARDRGRRMAFRRLIFGPDGLDRGPALETPDSAIPADEAVIARESSARLDHAIARLPARLKEAILLTAFEGLSHQEAADLLAVSAKTIETRVYRARQTLARALDPVLRPGA